MADAASDAPGHPVRLLAARLGCEAVAPLAVKDRRQAWLVRRAGADLVLKCWTTSGRDTPYPVVAHRLLAAIEGRFARLALPRYLYDGRDEAAGHYVMMTRLPGAGYEARWHYTRPGLAGGTALAPGDVDLALDLVEDLGRADLAPLLAAGLQVKTWGAAVRHAARRLDEIAALGIVAPAPAEAAREVIAAWGGPLVTAPLRLSNTDFRHMNFVLMDEGRAGIVDWDDAEASAFEVEHCVAYQWLFLWNRPDLQARLVAGARGRFGIAREAFRAVLMLRAILQIHTCRQAPERVAPHLAQVEAIADAAGFAAIWGGA